MFLRTEDFSVHMLFASEAEVEEFRQRGIDTRLWEPISLDGEKGLVVQPFSDEERRELEDDLGEIDGPEPE